ncbi:aldo/keto reductase [Brevibacillus sp. FSL K6-0770]|uniref:aldo/keto reductase n=1 Tax=unclassified Brevibacillus TaxID=2684853 RepID=UPI0024740964|nr:aldo/keto reductase [Brevibacillus sp. 1238]MDH6349563.1 aryl-alcohol dehydrogenase-like predicted oxidoreductase [Brevibacillus sp. 1238]
MITGKATLEGTQRLAQANPHLAYKPFGSFEVWISQVGFGTYRIDEQDEQYQHALRKALLEGINLIDTSSMYANGSAEKVIGSVLKQLVEEAKIKREELVIVSKAGIVVGEDSEETMKRTAEGKPYQDFTTVHEGMSICIHPEYLRDQLTRSLERLQLDMIDCYMLHNPEWYMLWAKMNKIKQQEAYEELLERIGKAFRHLEQEVEAGRIQCYGVSVNSFGSNPKEFDFVALDTLWEIAEAITPNHHFRVIQFPMNMYESGALLEKSHAQGKSALLFAKEKALGVMTNRTLDVTAKDKIFRLTDIRLDQNTVIDEKEATQQIKACLDRVDDVEDHIVYHILPALKMEKEEVKELKKKVSAGAMLRKYWKKLYSSANVNNVQTMLFDPVITDIRKTIEKHGGGGEETLRWLDTYKEALTEAAQALKNYYTPKDYQRAQDIRTELSRVRPHLVATDTLSQTAIRTMRATPEVHSVLVGMRREHYVDDVLTELQRPLDSHMQEEDWHTITQTLKAVIGAR